MDELIIQLLQRLMEAVQSTSASGQPQAPPVGLDGLLSQAPAPAPQTAAMPTEDPLEAEMLMRGQPQV